MRDPEAGSVSIIKLRGLFFVRIIKTIRKKKIYILLLGIVTGLTACSDWLDVQPKTEVKQDKMFESESGFKDALIGCYMLIGESSLYGQELTYTFLEVLAQQYDFVNSFHPYQQAKLYSYSTSSVETKINTIWSLSLIHI